MLSTLNSSPRFELETQGQGRILDPFGRAPIGGVIGRHHIEGYIGEGPAGRVINVS